MKKRWNYQPVLNVLMTLAIVVIAFPVFAPGTEVVPMAINFNGSTDYVNYGDLSAVRSLTQMSVCAWIRPETFGSESLGRIAEKLNYSPVGGWSFGTNNGAYTNSVVYTRGWSTSPGGWHVNNAVTLNAYNFLCVSYDGSSLANDPVFYGNGAALAAATEDVTPLGTLSADAGYNLYIGASSAGGNRFFDGSILDVRVYNFIITAADVANMYASRSFNVHPAQGLPVFQPILYGAAGLQAYDGAVLGASNLITDPYSGARGVPAGSPLGVAETYLTVEP